MPPPIPVGGASYAVTHSRRKYHHPRMCLMASALPGAVCGAGGVRSFPPGVVSPFPGENIPAHPPSGFTHTERVCSSYSVVSPGAPSVSGSSGIFCLAGFTCPLTGATPCKIPSGREELRQAVSSPQKCAAWGDALRPNGTLKGEVCRGLSETKPAHSGKQGIFRRVA